MDSKSKHFQVMEEVDLKGFNTLRVPSTARWFCNINNESDVLSAIDFVKTKGCPIGILGGGSNVVLPERFEGLVAHIRLRGRQILEESDTSVSLVLGAGESWHESVMWSVEQGYSGIENLTLIPGTVGAAPVQNIGAYGVELSDAFEYLEAIALNNGQRHRMDKIDCEFSYRDSVFKSKYRDRLLITKLVLRLHKQLKPVLGYPALAQHFAGVDLSALNPKQIADAVMAIRRRRLPDPDKTPNAGSFFKNPIVSAEHYQKLLDSYPDLIAFQQLDGNFKLAAGWLLERAGWKGKDENGILMHSQQALVLTNPESRSGRVLLEFADKVRDSIFRCFGVKLEIEPRIFN